MVKDRLHTVVLSCKAGAKLGRMKNGEHRSIQSYSAVGGGGGFSDDGDLQSSVLQLRGCMYCTRKLTSSSRGRIQLTHHEFTALLIHEKGTMSSYVVDPTLCIEGSSHRDMYVRGSRQALSGHARWRCSDDLHQLAGLSPSSSVDTRTRTRRDGSRVCTKYSTRAIRCFVSSTLAPHTSMKPPCDHLKVMS